MKIKTKISKKDKKFLALAMKIAENSTCSFRHGAVLVKGGRVLALGFNKHKNSSDMNPHHSYTIHAEMDCIKNVDASGATLYVARINRSCEAMMSFPCNECFKEIKKKNIKWIVFTD